MVDRESPAIPGGSRERRTEIGGDDTGMNDNHTRTVAIFAVVFFLLTLFSGAGFFGAIGSTVVATIIVHFGLRYFASRKAKRPPS